LAERGVIGRWKGVDVELEGCKWEIEKRIGEVAVVKLAISNCSRKLMYEQEKQK
jgi:hypothetical protein